MTPACVQNGASGRSARGSSQADIPQGRGGEIGGGLEPHRERRPLRQAGHWKALHPGHAIRPARPDEAPGPQGVPSADLPRHRRARRLPVRPKLEPDRMLRLGPFTFAPRRPHAEGEIGRVGVGRWREPPAERVVVRARGEPQPDIRAAGEATGKGREAVGGLRLPAAGGLCAPGTVGQRVGREQRIEPALGRSAPVLAQRQRQPALARRVRIEGKRGGEALVLQIVVAVRDQRPARKVEREPDRRIDPGDAAAEFQTRAGLGVAAVVARANLDPGRDMVAFIQGDAVAAVVSPSSWIEARRLFSH